MTGFVEKSFENNNEALAKLMLRRKKPKLKFNNILLSKNLQAGASKTARAEKKKGISQAKIPTLENLKKKLRKEPGHLTLKRMEVNIRRLTCYQNTR